MLSPVVTNEGHNPLISFSNYWLEMLQEILHESVSIFRFAEKNMINHWMIIKDWRMT